MAEETLQIILEALARNESAYDQMIAKNEALQASESELTKASQANTTAMQGLTNVLSSSSTKHEEHASAASKAAAEERKVSEEARVSARAFGSLGSEGAELVERFTNLTTAAGGFVGTGLGALVVGLGAAAMGVEKVNETYQEQQRAAGNLKQATDAMHVSYKDASRALEDYAAQHVGLISDVNQAEEAEAAFVRAGFDVKDSMTAVEVAVNLAAIKHEDLATAGHQVLLMLEGSGRVAKELGIDMKSLANSSDNDATAFKKLEEATKSVNTAQSELDTRSRILRDAQEQLKLKEDELGGSHKLTAAQADQLAMAHQRVDDAAKNLKDAQDKLTGAQQEAKTAQDNLATSHSAAKQRLDELNQKTADGTGALSDQQKAQKALKQEWDEFSSVTGPGVEKAFTGILNAADFLLGGLEAIAVAIGWLIQQSEDLIAAGNKASVSGSPPPGAPGSAGAPHGVRQHGGPVMPGGTYTVGEAGPETLVMGSSGGYVIPNQGSGDRPSGGGGVNLTFYIYGATDPLATGDAVSRQVSRLFG